MVHLWRRWRSEPDFGRGGWIWRWGEDRARSPGDAQIEELTLRGPGVKHGAFVDLFGARIVDEEHGGDVVGFAGVGESEERARAGDHAMALVLAVGGVANFLGESVVGVLQGAHCGRVDANV